MSKDKRSHPILGFHLVKKDRGRRGISKAQRHQLASVTYLLKSTKTILIKNNKMKNSYSECKNKLTICMKE
jgi:hypothetical protein